MEKDEEEALPPERGDKKLDIPPPTTDLASAYDAALSSLMEMHSQILQALQMHAHLQEEKAHDKATCTATGANGTVSFDLSSVKDHYPQTHHVAEQMVNDAQGQTPSNIALKRTFSVLAPATPAANDDAAGADVDQVREVELQELAAHHGVNLALKKMPSSEEVVRKDWMGRIVQHSAFDATASLMIFVNSIFIAVETQWMATNLKSPLFVQVMNYFCSFFFFVELIMRMMAYRIEFFTRPGSRGWNIFDLLLVLVSFVDLASAFFTRDPTVDVLQAVKILKMLRIARIFRVFRFSRELSLMALMIVDSMRSLMWAMLMLMLMIFVFAVWFTTNATFYLREYADTSSPTWYQDLQKLAPENVNDIKNNFGALYVTTYSLLRSMLGGINWGILCDMLLKMDTISPMLFIFYILFTMLAVLNIVTGVFVDNAGAAAKTQRDYIIEKEREVKETYIRELQNLFWQMDDDESGTLTAEEMQQLVKDPRMAAYFTALGFEPHDCVRLFTLLDTDSSGTVDIEEFLDGCLRLKGFARSIDVHFIMVLIHRLQKQLNGLVRHPERPERSERTDKARSRPAVPSKPLVDLVDRKRQTKPNPSALPAS